MSQKYICKCCGLHNDQVPMNYGADDPIYVTSMNEAERINRVQMNERLCIIDNEHYFVRGVIQIPVIDSDEMFSWGCVDNNE